MNNEVSTNTNTVETEKGAPDAQKTDKTDYKALYEAVKGERDAANNKLKTYEDREREQNEEERSKLPQNEQDRLAIEERDKTIASLKSRLNRGDLEKEFAKKGYGEEEYKDLLDAICSEDMSSKEKRYEARISVAKKILDFAEKQKEKYAESARINSVKDGVLFPQGNDDKKTKSGFKDFQEETAKTSYSGRVEL